MTRGYIKKGFAEPMRTAHLNHQVAVDDDKVETELVAHLVLPLQRQARRAHDHRGPSAVSQQQLLDNETGFDRLAEADVVSQQEVRARSTERPSKRFELVGLDVHTRPEWRLVAVRISSRDRTPTQSVDEPRERRRVAERLGGDAVRQTLSRGDRVANLEFPDHAQRLVEAILVQRLQVHHVRKLRRGLIGWAAGKALRLHVRNRPRRPANLGDLAGLRERWGGRGRCGRHSAHSSSRASSPTLYS